METTGNRPVVRTAPDQHLLPRKRTALVAPVWLTVWVRFIVARNVRVNALNTRFLLKMPAFRVGQKAVYFVHIPKCGGSSVEDYISQRFGKVSFYDGRWREGGKCLWYNSSPQHIPASTRSRLFHDDFFDASFAMVRHPERRMISAFFYNRHMKIIPWYMSFDQLLNKIGTADEKFHLRTDHHFLPMSEFITPDDAIFKLENDALHLIEWLDQISDDRAMPRSLPTKNSGLGDYLPSKNRTKNLIKKKLQPSVPTIDKHLSERIYDLYRKDYEIFHYEPTFLTDHGGDT